MTLSLATFGISYDRVLRAVVILDDSRHRSARLSTGAVVVDCEGADRVVRFDARGAFAGFDPPHQKQRFMVITPAGKS